MNECVICRKPVSVDEGVIVSNDLYFTTMCDACWEEQHKEQT